MVSRAAGAGGPTPPKKLTKVQEKNARRKAARKNGEGNAGAPTAAVGGAGQGGGGGGIAGGPTATLAAFLQAVNHRLRTVKRKPDHEDVAPPNKRPKA